MDQGYSRAEGVRKACDKKVVVVVLFAHIVISTINAMHESSVNLSESSGLTLPLHKRQDIALADGTLHVTDDGSVWIVEEFNTDLGDGTGVTGAAEHLVDLGKLDGLLL